MKNKDIYIIVASIIIAGLLIAGAVVYSSRDFKGAYSADKNQISQKQNQDEAEDKLGNFRPITSDDHILGNPEAPVKIIEYSDFECPFCQRFHETMNRVVDEYAGQVAWVYRHFPLDQLHSQARGEAVASECVAELGGNEAFWAFTNRFFELTPSNDQTNLSVVLPQIVSEIGIDQGAFDSCLASGKYDSHIQDDINDAQATGGRGTPWSIIVADNGQNFSVNGAQPYQSVKQLIDLALSEE